MTPAGQAALIVAHGQPSDPDGPEAAIRDLAGAVAANLPGWCVEGATLAGRGTLGEAMARLGDGPVLVHPHFMADGWFVTTRLPDRLSATGHTGWRVLSPFGLDPATPTLCLEAARDGAVLHGLDPGQTALLLAAHGSPSDPRAAAAARAVADAIAAAGLFKAVQTGFVDEAPYLADAARLPAPALCLPFFAAQNGHVLTDLPEALATAAFPGPTLAPIGTHPAVPALIAAALTRQASMATE